MNRIGIVGLPASLCIAVVLCSSLTACVTAKKYRLAKTVTPTVQLPALSASTPPLDLTLATVIAFKGPGAWKREARWDEYVVVLVNRGAQSVAVESAELIDLRGQAMVRGDDPWNLERLSRTNWDRYGKTGLKLVAGVGAATLYTAAQVEAGQAAIMSGGAAGGGMAAMAAIPVIGLVDVTAIAVMNHKNEARVRKEFQRRRLKPAFNLEPGESLTGSWFFPMTPGPQRLIVRGHDNNQPLEVVVQLGPICGLHLKQAK